MFKLSQRLSQYLLKWQESRAPKHKRVHLTQKNTYIFPTRYGFLLLLIVVLMGIGATNYQNNLIFIATFTVIALGLISILVTYGNLVGLQITVHQPEPVFAGQSAHIPVSLTSEKNHYAISIQSDMSALHTIDIVALAEHRLEVSHLYSTRGIHPIPRLRCQTVFPLGFLQAWSWVFLDGHCVVYPQPIKPEARFISGQSYQDNYSGDHQPGVEEFYGLRSYQKGDLLSRVHWKSFAREKGLQTKEFVDYLQDPDVFSYEDFPGVDPETRLSYLSFLVVQAEREKRQYGLALPGENITAGSGSGHLHRCLTALACFDMAAARPPTWSGEVSHTSQ